MTRRQEIENIIIGTILNSNHEHNYLNDCKSCITADMFSDERNKKIYSKAIEMLNAGYQDISQFTIIEYDNEMIQYIAYMCELDSCWYFLTKKIRYNESQWLSSLTRNYVPKYTNVTFSDYVTRFVQLVYIS